MPRRRYRPSPDQLELDLAATGPDRGRVIGADCGPIGASPSATARIIQFPVTKRAGLSVPAAAIFRDMQRCAIGTADGLACHSIADGVRCSKVARHKVVAARRELQDKGLVTLTRAGDHHGPAVWRICRTRRIAF